MRLLQKLWSIFCIILISINIGVTQDYLWPTDASYHLTSSFAEYRPGHFHAGIDIKTWGKIGYKVFAIRDGYITRLGVSPFGYGKVLYQKLDTGETVVYAHLDRFNDELNQFVKKEQKRNGVYRLNKYLDESQFPIKKGDFIGYTGASGIGSPHLHFETRDPNNNPMNPFLLGYKIEDTIPPSVNAISITPLDHFSRVNSDVIPYIEKPVLISNGNYKISSKNFISGKIGLAVDCYDQANGVTNTFAVYRVEFYVDSVQCFSATYNKFSYAVSHFIDLDRDFRLISRGKGLFQKLYKEKLNQLTFYKPMASEIGILNCKLAMNVDSYAQEQIDGGEHHFFIKVYDFFGNAATVSGNFIVGERAKITASFHFQAPNALYMSEIRDQNGNPVTNLEIFMSSDRGVSWRKTAIDFIAPEADSNSSPAYKYLLEPVEPLTLIKIQSVDDFGIESFPLYHIVESDSSITNLPGEIKLEQDFYDDYIRLKLTIDGLIRNRPQLLVQQAGLPITEIPLWPVQFNEYIGLYQLIPGNDGTLSIEAKAIDLSGRELDFYDQFEVQTVFHDRGGKSISGNGFCQVIFEPGAVYKNLFLRINQLGFLNDPNYEAIGDIYEIFPQDIPLKEKAIIELNYPITDSLPAKLGVYRVGKAKHNFVGNKIDYVNKRIRGQVSNLGMFTLIRDIIPPYINIQNPANNSQVSHKTVRFSAVVYDALSGIADERSIVMKVDGERVIAEYDPDARTIQYESEAPLLPGQHTVSVWAVDNSKNEASISHKFFVSN